MSEKDPNYIVKVEKAIAEKYGKEAIQNPRGSWDKEKENKYLEDMKAFYKKTRLSRSEDIKKEHNGFLISKRLINRKSNRKCPVCEKYSFELRDDLYMNKFECCFECYVCYIEGRENRWLNGWRPDNTRAIIK
jgi:hypothetical protein